MASPSDRSIPARRRRTPAVLGLAVAAAAVFGGALGGTASAAPETEDGYYTHYYLAGSFRAGEVVRAGSWEATGPLDLKRCENNVRVLKNDNHPEAFCSLEAADPDALPSDPYTLSFYDPEGVLREDGPFDVRSCEEAARGASAETGGFAYCTPTL